MPDTALPDGAGPDGGRRPSTPLFDTEFLAQVVQSTARRLERSSEPGLMRPWVHSTLTGPASAAITFTQYGRTFDLACDEAVERGGAGQAPSPMRYLLTGLAACAQVWCAKTAALSGIALAALEIDVDTVLDMRGEHDVVGATAHPAWFRFTVDLAPVAATPDEALVGLVRDALRRCPLSSLVAQAVRVGLVVRTGGRTLLEDSP